jgi:hypothetical protein
MTIGLFVQEAGNLLIENGWMERMLEAPTYKYRAFHELYLNKYNKTFQLLYNGRFLA